MRAPILKVLILIFTSGSVLFGAAVEPADKSLLHYNTVYVKDALVPGGAEYELRVYPDTLTEQPEFRTRKGIPAFTLVNLTWNRNYYWRVDVYDKTNKLIRRGSFHRFAVRRISSAFFDEQRVNVLSHNTLLGAGGLVSVDAIRSIVDRSGNPVWTLPQIRGVINDSSRVTDLRVTSDNTLTFFTEKSAYEIDLYGKVLWQLPEPFVLKGDTIRFHGTLRKNSKGNYYVSGSKKVYRKLLLPAGTNAGNNRGIRMVANEPHRRTETGLVMEFDRKGKLLWHWDANSALSDEALNFVKREGQMPHLISDMNAFVFNAKEDEFYVSFRALGMILRVNKKTGQVARAYGKAHHPSEKVYAAHLLGSPGDVNLSRDNMLLVFNNAEAGQRKASEIVIIRPDSVPGETMLGWRFALDFDTLSDGRSIKTGGIDETAKGTLLVCGGTTARLFEVDRQGHVVWDAFVLTKTKRDTAWKRAPQLSCRQAPGLAWYHVFVQPLASAEGKFKLALNNTGNVADSYQVRLYNNKKQLLYEGRSEVIQANAKAVLSIPLKANLPGLQMVAKVTSLASGITEEISIPGITPE